MGRFGGINKMLKMTLVKTLFLIVLLSVLGSCQNSQEDSNKQEAKNKDVKEKKIDLQNLDSDFIKKLVQHEISIHSIIKLFYPKIDNKDTKYKYEITQLNLDDNSDDDLILYIQSDETRLDNYVAIISNYENKYILNKVMLLDTDFNENPTIDSINKIFFIKQPVNGDCHDGFKFIGYKLLDGELKSVVELFGNHEGSSCGTYTEEDDAKKDFEFFTTLESTFEIQSKNTIINYCTISHWKFDYYMDTWTEKIITDKEIKIYFKYNPKTKYFDCFNSDNHRLFEDSFIGMSFDLVKLTKEGKL